MYQKKFLRYTYAAIKRYGDRKWTAHSGQIEINPCYTVSAGECALVLNDAHDKAYIFELSNGTKFIALFNDVLEDAEVISEQGEYANSLARKELHDEIKRNLYQLDTYNERKN